MAVRWRSAICGPLAREVIQAPCGYLEILSQGEVITALAWRMEGQGTETSLGLTAIGQQLAAYFRDPCWRFDCDLAEQGTAFCRRVWQVLLAIPPGQACTYGELARSLGSSARAVAAACRANPYPIIIPCHRVIAKEGLGGYCGASDGLPVLIKRWLLRHEGWIKG